MDIPIVGEPVLRTPWFNKFVECFFAGVASINTLFFFIQVLPRDLLMKLGPFVFTALLLGQFVIGIGFALVYAFYWHHKETRKWIGSEARARTGAGTGNRIDSGKRHAWLQGILRYDGVYGRAGRSVLLSEPIYLRGNQERSCLL